jgi:hypothetical protein
MPGKRYARCSTVSNSCVAYDILGGGLLGNGGGGSSIEIKKKNMNVFIFRFHEIFIFGLGVRFMVFNATFNSISVTLWW